MGRKIDAIATTAGCFGTGSAFSMLVFGTSFEVAITLTVGVLAGAALYAFIWGPR